jgi:hypothetical protein
VERRFGRKPGAKVLSPSLLFTPGKRKELEKSKVIIAGAWCMGGHLTDLKIWLFSRSEEGENIKNKCKKAWKIVSHNKL